MSSPSSAEAAFPAALAIHLDLVGGLAGDMFVAAMLDALPALAPPVFAALAKVQPAGEGAPELVATTQAGLRAARFAVTGRRPASAAAQPHAAGRRYVELRAVVADAGLRPDTAREAIGLLDTLARAEAHVHGIAIDDVHFHELADWHSLLDVVAAGCIIAELRGATWTASPPPLGAGTVRAAHGLLPLPAPATAHLLVGYPWRDDGIGGERVTPTGAAILRRLVPAERMRIGRGGRLVAIGQGAGSRQVPGLCNVTRALVFDPSPDVDRATAITAIEFDVDDMTGEEIGLAADRLRALPGVLDVSIGARLGKKGRPASDFRLLVTPAAADEIAQACFVETSTLGLRVADVRRHVLRRVEGDVAVDAAGMAVKVAQRPDGARTAKASHDDVGALGSLAERRRQRAEAERKALDGDSCEPAGLPPGRTSPEARNRGG